VAIGAFEKWNKFYDHKIKPQNDLKTELKTAPTKSILTKKIESFGQKRRSNSLAPTKSLPVKDLDSLA